jgi:hypothetical protein
MATTSELHTLNDDPGRNTEWIRAADPGFDRAFYDDRVVLNSGLMFGSIQGFMLFYSVLLKLPAFANFRIETKDQGYVNYAYHRSLFADAWLNLTVTHPGDYLLSVRGGQFYAAPDSNGLFRMKGAAVPPAAIHQYNRICPLVRGIRRSCARMWFDKFPFAEEEELSQECTQGYADKALDIASIDRVKAIVQKIDAKIPGALKRIAGRRRE